MEDGGANEKFEVGMKYIVKIGEDQLIFNYDANSGKISNQNENDVQYDWVEVGNGCYSLLLNGRSYLLHLQPSNGDYQLYVDGQLLAASVQDEQNLILDQFIKQHKSEPKEQVLKAPIPGLVTKVFAEPGAQIKKDEPLMTLEAMKMENLIKAPCVCQVKKIFVQPGQTVQQNQELILLKKVD